MLCSVEVKWTFLTVHHWGESPVGEWMLSVEDTASSSSSNEVAIGEWLIQSLLYGPYKGDTKSSWYAGHVTCMIAV